MHAELLTVQTPQKSIDFNKIKSIKMITNSEYEEFLELLYKLY